MVLAHVEQPITALPELFVAEVALVRFDLQVNVPNVALKTPEGFVAVGTELGERLGEFRDILMGRFA